MTEIQTAAAPVVTAVAADGKCYSTAWSALLAHDPAEDVWLYRSGLTGHFFTATYEAGAWVIDPVGSATAYLTYKDMPVKDAGFAAVKYSGSFA